MTHAFGHIHPMCGIFNTPDTLFVNSALQGQGYDLINSQFIQDSATVSGRRSASGDPIGLSD